MTYHKAIHRGRQGLVDAFIVNKNSGELRVNDNEIIDIFLKFFCLLY